MRRLTVRHARPHDTERVVGIERACFTNPNPTLLANVCGMVDGFLVAETDDCIAGYVLFTPSSAEDARVLSLAVAPGNRRQGVATRLMRGAFDVLRGRDFDAVSLEVRVSNTAAQSLYDGLGFLPVGVEECYYDDGEDAYLMEKEL
ncbi:ribosomal protein S18-alanine N-acetyltransferase [Haladaptatus sp. F3-133]|jgi:ribosomal-protein-alanine N-acetyltransferase|uniref:Ribosomal protein S18-alanine N-acetyltransferase n=1 Tax=Halorutilus salinus TaxID=2487751 RepID=A0A9Q4C5F8_9EURY|nr:ribosomal protein S18-alanine N-acetyltransferase [Halorutilus salinus]MCX2819284.1 ribosomal protein S18-alanine N-acetyltransferase [Halorutilus salinus]